MKRLLLLGLTSVSMLLTTSGFTIGQVQRLEYEDLVRDQMSAPLVVEFGDNEIGWLRYGNGPVWHPGICVTLSQSFGKNTGLPEVNATNNSIHDVIELRTIQYIEGSIPHTLTNNTTNIGFLIEPDNSYPLPAVPAPIFPSGNTIVDWGWLPVHVVEVKAMHFLNYMQATVEADFTGDPDFITSIDMFAAIVPKSLYLPARSVATQAGHGGAVTIYIDGQVVQTNAGPDIPEIDVAQFLGVDGGYLATWASISLDEDNSPVPNSIWVKATASAGNISL